MCTLYIFVKCTLFTLWSLLIFHKSLLAEYVLMHYVPLIRSWPIPICNTTHVATWKKVNKGCLWSVAIGYQMDLLFKVRNTNHHYLFSLWKKCSALFGAYPVVNTCLSLSLNDTFLITEKKIGEFLYLYAVWEGFFGRCLFFNYTAWLKHYKEKWYCTHVTLHAHLKHAGSYRQTKLALLALSLGWTGRLQASLCLKAA